MSTPAEVAVLIKLGADIDISEYGLTIEDMIPYFDSEISEVAGSRHKTVNITKLKDPITFRVGVLNFNKGDILKSEEQEI